MPKPVKFPGIYIEERPSGGRAIDGIDTSLIPAGDLAPFIEESLASDLQWVVFEHNDEQLWTRIRSDIGTFMLSLFRQGAFQGGEPDEAFFVKCDSETTTQADISAGIVNIIIGFAPLRPAEFAIIRLSLSAEPA